MPKSIKTKKIFTLMMTFALILSILWSLPQAIRPISAAAAYSLSVLPTRIQEGLDTNVTLELSGGAINHTYTFQANVTSPRHASFLNNFNLTTDSTGSGSKETIFWKDFPSPANTSLIGTYTVVIQNVTTGLALASSSFSVGLTDKTVYLKSENVSIRAAGYAANESVTVDLKHGGTSVSGFPQTTLQANAGGVVSLSWLVPTDAALGVYTVSVTTNNSTTGTIKAIADSQTFTVEGVCEVQVKNLAGQTLASANVEVYNATTGVFLSLSQNTNSTGWVRFVLAAGNYTFKVFWLNVEVGSETQLFTGNFSFTLFARLSNLKLTVQNTSSASLPWVSLAVSYKYTTRASQIIPVSNTYTTNLTGEVILKNVFTGIDYNISASRYSFVFATTTVSSLPAQPWNNITIIAPTYTMVVTVLDSQGNPAAGLQVSVYEWSSGISEPVASKPLENGNASFALTVGRYVLRFSKGSTFVNEVTVDLTRDQMPVLVKNDVYNINLHVVVVDYFGQPMPNVSVDFQRKVDSTYQSVDAKITGTDGAARFDGVIGGDSLLQVSWGNTVVSSQYLYLAGASEDVVFRLGAYVSVFGAAVDAGVFVSVILILMVLIGFALYLIRGKLPHLSLRRQKRQN